MNAISSNHDKCIQYTGKDEQNEYIFITSVEHNLPTDSVIDDTKQLDAPGNVIHSHRRY